MQETAREQLTAGTELEWLDGGGVTSARGWLAEGVAAGIKRKRPDVGLLWSDRTATVAAVYTRNRVVAAPVRVARQVTERGTLRALAVNSGNANACTGAEGEATALWMQAQAAALSHLSPSEVAIASTGVIGVPLPREPLAAGLRACAAGLSASGGERFAEALRTTDTATKQAALRLAVGGSHVTVGGAAKGSGMIHPNMGTMLAFVTSDAQVPAAVLQPLWREVVDRTFNMVSVDGDTSTNDAAFLMSNGAAGVELAPGLPGWEAWCHAVEEVARHLARAIAADGEGASRLITVAVSGLPDVASARSVARSIAGSSLVKSAVYGRDPNWGRVLAAAGRAPLREEVAATLDWEHATLRIGGVTLLAAGQPTWEHEQEAHEALGAAEVLLELQLDGGPATATAWGCDLTPEYVQINASYRS